MWDKWDHPTYPTFLYALSNECKLLPIQLRHRKPLGRYLFDKPIVQALTAGFLE